MCDTQLEHKAFRAPSLACVWSPASMREWGQMRMLHTHTHFALLWGIPSSALVSVQTLHDEVDLLGILEDLVKLRARSHPIYVDLTT
eukprot:1722208-Amphidinium_carterae.4